MCITCNLHFAFNQDYHSKVCFTHFLSLATPRVVSPPSKPLIVVVVVVVVLVVVVVVLVLAVHTHVLVVSGAVSCGVVGREQRAEGRELIGFLPPRPDLSLAAPAAAAAEVAAAACCPPLTLTLLHCSTVCSSCSGRLLQSIFACWCVCTHSWLLHSFIHSNLVLLLF